MIVLDWNDPARWHVVRCPRGQSRQGAQRVHSRSDAAAAPPFFRPKCVLNNRNFAPAATPEHANARAEPAQRPDQRQRIALDAGATRQLQVVAIHQDVATLQAHRQRRLSKVSVYIGIKGSGTLSRDAKLVQAKPVP